MDRCSHQEEIRKRDNNLSCVTIFFCRLFMQFSLASDYLPCVSMAYNYYEIEKCKVVNTDDGIDERYQLRLLRYALISYIKPAWRARHLPEALGRDFGRMFSTSAKNVGADYPPQ